MKQFFALFAMLLAVWLTAAENNAFKWSANVSALKNGRYKVQVQCHIAVGSYLSSESVKVEVTFSDNSTAAIKSPPATPGKDGELIYPAGICRWVMFAAQEPLKVTADFQGCIKDMCLMPETLTIWQKKQPFLSQFVEKLSPHPRRLLQKG